MIFIEKQDNCLQLYNVYLLNEQKYLYDLHINEAINYILNSNSNEKCFCFDIKNLGLPNNSFVYLYDLQALAGLQQVKADSVEQFLQNDDFTRYVEVEQKIKNILKSFKICGIDIRSFAISKVISNDMMELYLKEKANFLTWCCKHYASNTDVVKYYENIYYSFYKLLLSNIKLHVCDEQISVEYSLFGQKNSRLSLRGELKKLYSLHKDKRSSIKADEGSLLVQADYNSFQVRLAIAVHESDSIKNLALSLSDIYSYFDGNREDNKLKIISWLFSESSEFDNVLPGIAKSKQLMKSGIKNKQLLNTFGRPLFFEECEKYNVVYQNFISSLEADLMIALSASLLDIRSDHIKFLFPFHDCVVLQVTDNESLQSNINMLKCYIENFTRNKFGYAFPVGVKTGKNFSDMEKYEFDLKKTETQVAF